MFYDVGYNLLPIESSGFLGLLQLQYQKATKHEILEIVVRDNSDLIPVEHPHLSLLSGFAFRVPRRMPELRDRYISQFWGGG